MPTLYFDNDADLFVRKVPATATVQWAVVAQPADYPDTPISIPAVPVNAALSGTMTYNATRRRFEDVLEGGDIRQYLTPTSSTTNTPLYAVVYWWAENLRKIIPDVIVKADRL